MLLDVKQYKRNPSTLKVVGKFILTASTEADAKALAELAAAFIDARGTFKDTIDRLLGPPTKGA